MPPDRNGPIRNPLAPRPVPQQPHAPNSPAAPGALENGVRTAYAVIDEYMRRGQEAARGFSSDPDKRDDMSDYRGNYGGGFNPWGPFAIFAEQWMRTWSQAFSNFMPGWPQPGWPAAGYQAGAPRVSIQVSSARPAEVTASLQPGMDSQLACDPLRPETCAASPIDPPSVVCDPVGVRISVRVNADQPVGRYRGCIRRKTDGNAAGEITVVIT